MNKFEKLIEYVINDEDAKAQSLFHEIVVAKSRNIYEGLMDSDDRMGGRETDQLINDVESEENGMGGMNEAGEDEFGAGEEMGGEEMGMDEPELGDEMGMGDDDMGDMGDEAELEDRVVDLEDQLDALMAEFDSIVGGDEEGEEFGGDDMENMGDDEFGADDEMGDEMGDEMEPAMEESFSNELEEAVSLTKVSKGIASKSEEAGTNTKTINNDNSGKKLTGGSANPVNFGSTDEKGAGKVSYKDEGYTTEPRESKVTKGVANKSEEAGTDKQSLVKARK